MLRVTRVQSLAGQFEQLALGPGGPAAPGQPPEMATDPGQYPRPLRPGSGDAPPPFDQHSCRPAFMRMTVNAIPSSQALKARRDSGGLTASPSAGLRRCIINEQLHHLRFADMLGTHNTVAPLLCFRDLPYGRLQGAPFYPMPRV